MLFVGLASSIDGKARGTSPNTASTDTDRGAEDTDARRNKDNERRDFVFVSLGDSITSAFNTRFLGSTANQR